MIRRFITFICFLMLAGGVHSSFAAETVRINGSGSCLDMMKPMVKAYSRANPNVNIEMTKPLGSSGAIKALLAGVLDIAVSSKQLKPEEISQGAIAREFGQMPLVIVTHKGLGKTGITTRELEDIYSGRIRNWPNGELIRLVMRPEGDIDTKILRTLSPGIDKAMTQAQKREGMTIAVTDPESNEAVVKTPGAIGATGLSSVIVEKLSLNQLALNGVSPTAKELASGRYPLAKDIRIVTTAKTPQAARKFIDFIYSAKGRIIAEKAGAVVVPAGKPGI